MNVSEIDCASLGEDPVDLARVDVEAPRLPDDTAASCPVTMQRIRDYVGSERPDGDALRAEDLTFLRTARVGDSDYWVWSFVEPEGGEAAYAWVEVKPRRSRLLGRSSGGDRVESIGYETDLYGLSVPQLLVGIRCGQI